MYGENNWLSSWEKRVAIEKLLRFGLIKYDNRRNLPLKSGGFTDIYIMLRDARSSPEAIQFLATCFRNPLLRMDPDRFVEVPDSVSCFAGPLSILTEKPYLTIREKPKEGRVANAKIIGNASFGETVVIFDDVITDGASKIPSFHECQRMGLQVLPLVVLVDRQQGWKKKFAKEGINVDVWAGMTLHDIRRYLIDFGLMERCKKEIEEKNPLIVALDGKSWEEILPIIDELRTTGCILKVNDLLFNEGFRHLLPNLQVYGRIMADLKGHDISNTLENISKHFLPYPPWAVTVHASGSEKMMRAVVDKLSPTETKVLAVTVLTSFDKDTCKEVYFRRPLNQVKKLAEIAHRSGVHGLVCSPKEAPVLKEKYPKMLCVTPGVRSAGADVGDQKRVATPAEARENGADYLVMGRQILGAPDPVAEVHRILIDELKVL